MRIVIQCGYYYAVLGENCGPEVLKALEGAYAADKRCENSVTRFVRKDDPVAVLLCSETLLDDSLGTLGDAYGKLMKDRDEERSRRWKAEYELKQATDKLAVIEKAAI